MQNKFKLFIAILLGALSLAHQTDAALTIRGVNFRGVSVVNNNTPKPLLMALGDSITFGYQPQGIARYSYRRYLYPLTARSFKYVGETCTSRINTYGCHSGVVGEWVSDVKARLANDLTNLFPSTILPHSSILIHAGTNDMYSDYRDIASAVADTMSMVDMIHAHNPTIDIYVALIIPLNHPNDSYVTTFNSQLDSAITAKKITVTNLYKVDMNAAFKANPSWAADYMTDYWHPNAAGYQVMAQTWANAINAN